MFKGNSFLKLRGDDWEGPAVHARRKARSKKMKKGR